MSDINPTNCTSKKKYKCISLACLFILLILLAYAGITILFKQVHASRAQQKQMKYAVMQLQATLSHTQAILEEQTNDLQEEHQLITQLVKQKPQAEQSWSLAEAQYLVHLAYFNLQFQGNITQALQLLQAADNRIASLHNPNYIAVRQQLANNIAALNAIPKIDDEGILIQLNALSTQVKELPLIATPEDVKTVTHDHHHRHPIPGWKKNLEESWRQIERLIVVQYHNQPVGQLVAPQNRMILDMHLQMLLTQAQWAVINQKSQAYQNSITSALDWVKNYYVQTSPKTQAMVQSLASLQAISLTPSLPDLTGLVNSINQVNVAPTPVAHTEGQAQ